MKKYVVTLSDKERKELRQMVRRGTAAARKLSRGRILLKADEQEGWTDVAIADAFEAGRPGIVPDRFLTRPWLNARRGFHGSFPC